MTNVFTFTLVSLAITVSIFAFSIHLASGTLSLHSAFKRVTPYRSIDLFLSIAAH
jgi:hypothetical protein